MTPFLPFRVGVPLSLTRSWCTDTTWWYWMDFLYYVIFLNTVHWEAFWELKRKNKAFLQTYHMQKLRWFASSSGPDTGDSLRRDSSLPLCILSWPPWVGHVLLCTPCPSLCPSLWEHVSPSAATLFLRFCSILIVLCCMVINGDHESKFPGFTFWHSAQSLTVWPHVYYESNTVARLLDW